MWNISVSFLGVVIFLTLGGEANIEWAADSNQIFSRIFFAAVGSASTGNVICSPLSAQLALGLTRLGTKGTTKAQLTEKLGLRQNEDDNKQAFIALRDELMSENVDGNILRIANKMYTANSLNLLTEFERNSLEIFGAERSPVNFEDPKTRLIINEWVKNVTEDKIKNLIQEGSLDESMKLVLVNALYFKGFWKTAFERSRTSEKNFYMDNQQEVKIPMMFQEGDFKMTYYYPDLNASVLELPYKGDHFSLVIVMPTSIHNLPTTNRHTLHYHQMENNQDIRPSLAMSISDLEIAMRTRELGDLLNKTRQVHDLEVYLPKFTMKLTLDLKDPLQDMGISEIFGGRADLSGISNVSKLFVSKVVQKTFIDITEKGTEAAAATFVGSQLLSYQLPTRFIVNHPFLFYVVHRKNSNIPPIVLFSGRYVTPP